MNSPSHKLVFVYLGKRLPRYAKISLRLAQQYSGMEVVLVSERIFRGTGLQDCNMYIVDGQYKNNISIEGINEKYKNFRKGFWIKTTERFYALREYMQESNSHQCFHAELDNLVFANLGLAEKLNQYGTGLFLPFDSTNRAIASLIYINSIDALDKFCAFSTQHIGQKNDMELLAMFGASNWADVYALPTSPGNETLKTGLAKLGIKSVSEIECGIFDAAAIGQWYFGVDPRNSYFSIRNQYVNEVSKLDMKSFRMVWNHKTSSFEATMVDQKDKNLLVNNLHVHSKVHRKLARQSTLLSIASRTDKGKKILISINARGYARAVFQLVVHLSGRLKTKTWKSFR